MRLHPFPAVVALAATVANVASAADAPPATPPITPAGPPRVRCTEYQWKRGDPPVRMLKKDEGVCYLTGVRGQFAGGAESALVYLDDDGYWYLGGEGAKDVGATAIAVRFPGNWVVEVARAPSGRELADLTLLAKSTTPAVRDAAAEELKPVPPGGVDPEAQFARAMNWLSLADKEPDKAARGTMEAHAIDVLRAAAPTLPEAMSAKATALAAQRTAAFLAAHFDELAHWDVQNGQWESTPDGKIKGSGDCNLQFRFPLPADGDLSFHLSVVDGMRPRVRFEGTDLYFGNEGYERFLEAHGATAQRGVRFPYKHNQDVRVEFRFRQAEFEMLIDGQPMSRGTRKRVPDTLRLKISGGDDWSKGACLFWGFEFKPAKPADGAK